VRSILEFTIVFKTIRLLLFPTQKPEPLRTYTREPGPEAEAEESPTQPQKNPNPTSPKVPLPRLTLPLFHSCSYPTNNQSSHVHPFIAFRLQTWNLVQVAVAYRVCLRRRLPLKDSRLRACATFGRREAPQHNATCQQTRI
jgi:hypothetical protein